MFITAGWPRQGPEPAGSREAPHLNVPNLITLARIILVPVVVWAIASNQMEIAFAVFVVAGVSDAVDGFLAKRFNMSSTVTIPTNLPPAPRTGTRRTP